MLPEGEEHVRKCEQGHGNEHNVRGNVGHVRDDVATAAGATACECGGDVAHDERDRGQDRPCNNGCQCAHKEQQLVLERQEAEKFGERDLLRCLIVVIILFFVLYRHFFCGLEVRFAVLEQAIRDLVIVLLFFDHH